MGDDRDGDLINVAACTGRTGPGKLILAADVYGDTLLVLAYYFRPRREVRRYVRDIYGESPTFSLRFASKLEATLCATRERTLRFYFHPPAASCVQPQVTGGRDS